MLVLVHHLLLVLICTILSIVCGMYTWLYDLKASDWILVLKPGSSSNTYDALSSITIRRTQNVHIGITYKVLAVISFRNNTHVVTRGVVI